MLIGNAQLELITLGLILLAVSIHFLAEKPVFVNFLKKPNPNSEVTLKLNDKN